jgi:hypothetical protein
LAQPHREVMGHNNEGNVMRLNLQISDTLQAMLDFILWVCRVRTVVDRSGSNGIVT